MTFHASSHVCKLGLSDCPDQLSIENKEPQCSEQSAVSKQFQVFCSTDQLGEKQMNFHLWLQIQSLRTVLETGVMETPELCFMSVWSMKKVIIAKL